MKSIDLAKLKHWQFNYLGITHVLVHLSYSSDMINFDSRSIISAKYENDGSSLRF